jgi:hypothetical protein
MANRLRNERIEIKLTKKKKNFLRKNLKSASQNQWDSFYQKKCS